jgi:hypothetical protein
VGRCDGGCAVKTILNSLNTPRTLRVDTYEGAVGVEVLSIADNSRLLITVDRAELLEALGAVDKPVISRVYTLTVDHALNNPQKYRLATSYAASLNVPVEQVRVVVR